MNKLFRILIPAAVLAIVAGCTREKTLSTGDKVKEYLELYMSANYPDIKPDQWGMYILEDTPGTGAGWNKEYTYSYLRSTIRSIDGTILSTTEADVAKQLDQDSYKAYNYYGPRYQATTEENGYAGLEYMLEGMK